MQDMNDWLVTVLISVRDMAHEAQQNAVVEMLDDTILVAVNACEYKDISQGQINASSGKAWVRRYH